MISFFKAPRGLFSLRKEHIDRPLYSFPGRNKFDTQVHVHTSGKALKGAQGWISGAVFQLGNISLIDAGAGGKLLLGEAGSLAGIDHSLLDGYSAASRSYSARTVGFSSAFFFNS